MMSEVHQRLDTSLAASGRRGRESRLLQQEEKVLSARFRLAPSPRAVRGRSEANPAGLSPKLHQETSTSSPRGPESLRSLAPTHQVEPDGVRRRWPSREAPKSPQRTISPLFSAPQHSKPPSAQPSCQKSPWFWAVCPHIPPGTSLPVRYEGSRRGRWGGMPRSHSQQLPPPRERSLWDHQSTSITQKMLKNGQQKKKLRPVK